MIESLQVHWTRETTKAKLPQEGDANWWASAGYIQASLQSVPSQMLSDCQLPCLCQSCRFFVLNIYRPHLELCGTKPAEPLQSATFTADTAEQALDIAGDLFVRLLSDLAYGWKVERYLTFADRIALDAFHNVDSGEPEDLPPAEQARRFNKNPSHDEKNQEPTSDTTGQLFIGHCAGAGIVYADRFKEVNRDYQKIAFLSFHDLQLEIYEHCPEHLIERIVKNAAFYQAEARLDEAPEPEPEWHLGCEDTAP